MAKKKKTTVEPVKDSATTKENVFTLAIKFDDGTDQLKASVHDFFVAMYATDPTFNEETERKVLDDIIVNKLTQMTQEELGKMYMDILGACYTFFTANKLFYKYDENITYHVRSVKIGETLKNIRTQLDMILGITNEQKENPQET